jgi:hypothetical protein
MVVGMIVELVPHTKSEFLEVWKRRLVLDVLQHSKQHVLHRRVEQFLVDIPFAIYKRHRTTREYPKVSGLSHNEINNNNKHSLRSNIKGYGGKTH